MAKPNVGSITSGIHEKMYRVYFERYMHLSERSVELFNSLEDDMIVSDDGETYEIDPTISGNDEQHSDKMARLSEAYATLNEANQVFEKMNGLRHTHLSDVGFHLQSEVE